MERFLEVDNIVHVINVHMPASVFVVCACIYYTVQYALTCNTHVHAHAWHWQDPKELHMNGSHSEEILHLAYCIVYVVYTCSEWQYYINFIPIDNHANAMSIHMH